MYYTFLNYNVCYSGTHMYNSADVFSAVSIIGIRITKREKEVAAAASESPIAISNLIETINTPYMHTIVLLNNFVDVISFMS